MPKLKVGIAGAAGRMGQLLLAELKNHPQFELACGLDKTKAPVLNITDEVAEFFKTAEAVVDFSTATATAKIATLAAESGIPLVIGTTGFDEATHTQLSELGCRIPILVAANMSYGIEVMNVLTAKAAKLLDWDIEISDIHHKAKLDAPSGTALTLGKTAGEARGNKPTNSAPRTTPRKQGEIGYAATRGGDVVGEHHLNLMGEGERLVISHIATDRSIYAKGALKALNWLRSKPPGLYTFSDCVSSPQG